MFKKNVLVIVFLSLCLNVSFALNRQVIAPTEISIKAGPTEPDEPVRLLWLESYVYPREVKPAGLISLGVRGTSKVEAIKASFDFSKKTVDLVSPDNLNWSAVYETPADLAAGIHVVRYEIANQQGKIKRTVDFFVTENTLPDRELSHEKISQNRNFPITVVATTPALVGNATRLLYPGEEIIAVSKVPWYKVLLADGAEGWVSTTVVKEPLEEYYLKGYESYQRSDYLVAIEYYKNCIAIDPNFVKGHYWLAKSYHCLGDLDAAYLSLQEAIRLDERNLESKILANVLAQKFYERAKEKYAQGRFNEAVIAYQRVLDLKPTSIASWLDLGYSYQQLALYNEAKNAWKEGLKHDSNNQQLLALLGVEAAPAMVAATNNTPKPQVKTASAGLPASVVDDSLAIVRLAKTERGTKIETALKSVVSLTKSLGTPVVEKGWQTVKQGDKYLVRYLCEQGVGVVEAFEWLVDIDTKKLSASNDNARLLMNRW